MTGTDGGDVDEALVGDETLARMVGVIDDSWTLRERTRLERGGNEVYRVRVETAGGQRRCVLKVAGPGGGGDLSMEPRLLRLLGAETDVPVPAVHGVVDDHPDLPAPFFVMEWVDGDHLPADPAEPALDELVAYARAVGRYLGDVHALDAVDGFGPLVATHDVEPNDRGGTRPLAREYDLTIPEPTPTWDAKLAETVEWMLDALGETRFGDLAPEIRAAIEEWRTELHLTGPPVIARLDHSLQNLLVDREARSVRTLLDWGLARTTHPEYELACAEHGFAATAPLDGDRRLRLREALYEGYRVTNDLPDDGDFARRRRLSMLVFQTFSMNWAEGWITADIAADVERDNRRFVDELLSREP